MGNRHLSFINFREQAPSVEKVDKNGLGSHGVKPEERDTPLFDFSNDAGKGNVDTLANEFDALSRIIYGDDVPEGDSDQDSSYKATTLATNEEGGDAYTDITLTIGENGGEDPTEGNGLPTLNLPDEEVPNPSAITLVIGENGGEDPTEGNGLPTLNLPDEEVPNPSAITLTIGENGGDYPTMVTAAVGEDGTSFDGVELPTDISKITEEEGDGGVRMTTLAVGEEGGEELNPSDIIPKPTTEDPTIPEDVDPEDPPSDVLEEEGAE